MNVTILGAAGEVGRALSTHLLCGGFMLPTDTLQLVGHEGTGRTLLAEGRDLRPRYGRRHARLVDVLEWPRVECPR